MISVFASVPPGVWKTSGAANSLSLSRSPSRLLPLRSASPLRVFRLYLDGYRKQPGQVGSAMATAGWLATHKCSVSSKAQWIRVSRVTVTKQIDVLPGSGIFIVAVHQDTCKGYSFKWWFMLTTSAWKRSCNWPKTQDFLCIVTF